VSRDRIFAAILFPCLAFGQAWVNPKGEGSVSFNYSNWYAKHHLLTSGARVDRGLMKTQVLAMGFNYGLTDRLTFTAEAPLVFARYVETAGSGTASHGVRPHTIDDGFWHATVTDVRMEARYNLAARPLVVTPFFAAIIPTHTYETFGHASPGRDLREYQLGVGLGRQLRPLLSRAFLDVRYMYSFNQKVLDIAPNRSNIDAQLTYFVRPRFSVRAFGGWQKTHAGVELPVPADDRYFPYHDRLQRAHYARTGGAATYSLRPTLDLFGFATTILSGKNSHAPTIIGAGVIWSFSTRKNEDFSSINRMLATPIPGATTPAAVPDRIK